ncbi:MAG: peptide-methionine (S)-S-oxide reductase MsrA [Candidatus Levybacteria bacterium]|nr:peptide-methionine (S)-S-oxide reductase MsrA [Candidatus Levybacteria bacterium]
MDTQYETATFANGCFWCTEAIFQRLKGVKSVSPGYTGGTTVNPSYEDVCNGNTGHAEALQIVFDPSVITYEKLLDVYWHTHNPTTLNRQGNDVGTQYRSVIFYQNDRQKDAAEKSKMELEESGYYPDPIVTKIEPLNAWFAAEDYHKDYYNKNGSAGYCSVIIDPKVRKFIAEYSQDVQDKYK